MICVGVWLGNPFGREGIEKIFIPDVNRRDVWAVEAMSKETSKFSLALVDVFFSRETLAKSLVTQKEGRQRLDPDIIEGIRRKQPDLINDFVCTVQLTLRPAPKNFQVFRLA